MTTNGTVDHVAAESIQVHPRYEESPRSSLVLSIASVADDIMPWGAFPHERDLQLRGFWPTEPLLASAIYTTVIRNAAFSWTLEGPPRTVKAYQQMFHEADLGGGWEQFAVKTLTDYLTQDNGMFIEVIRADNGSPESPVIGFAHLDAGRCRRTGVREWPVIYIDRNGAQHKLRPWQVIARAEYPSPVETMNGVGLCAVSRVLRTSQLMRDIGIYMREKVGGNNPAAIHLVNGINASEITDAMAAHRNTQQQRGNMRYLIPLVLASIDPTGTISHEQIDLASLPDNFDYDVMQRWYITALAMALGIDSQDLAPLTGQALGTGAQSAILHMKNRGMGQAFYTKTMEHLFNFCGILPQNITFRYDEEDIEADSVQAQLNKLRAETRAINITSYVLTPEVARQQMLDEGEISQEMFDALQAEPPVIPQVDVVAEDGEQEGGAQSKPNQQTTGDETKEKKAEPLDFAEAERLAWEDEMADAMEAALAETLVEVRRAVLGRKSVLPWVKDETTALELPDEPSFWERMRRRIMGAMLPFSRKVPLDAGTYNVELGIAVDMDLVNQQVLEFSRTYTSHWYADIEETTKRAMRSAIVAWQETGLGQRGLPDLVDALEPLFGQERAKRIAATEVTSLFAEGSKLAYASAGLEQVEYQTVRDELVCPICVPLDGKRYPVKEAPTPAMHVRCRCALLPVNNAGLSFGRYKSDEPEPIVVPPPEPEPVIEPVIVPPPVVTVEKQVIRDVQGRIDRVIETVKTVSEAPEMVAVKAPQPAVTGEKQVIRDDFGRIDRVMEVIKRG